MINNNNDNNNDDDDNNNNDKKSTVAFSCDRNSIESKKYTCTFTRTYRT